MNRPKCSDLASRLSRIDDIEDPQILRESLRCLIVAMHDLGGCDAVDSVMRRAKRIRDHRVELGVTSI